MTRVTDFRAKDATCYTLDEFMTKYALDARVAEDLHSRFGPSKIELDVLMQAMHKRRNSAETAPSKPTTRTRKPRHC